MELHNHRFYQSSESILLSCVRGPNREREVEQIYKEDGGDLEK